MTTARTTALIALGTKAETLVRLAPRVQQSRVLEAIVIDVARWAPEREAILDNVQAAFADRPVIVRSSARSEDTATASLAGAHTTILDVNTPERADLVQAIDAVIDSYGTPAPDDQVLVQEQLCDVVLSGVLFTRDLNTLAPYYVFNYDDTTKRTDSVTGGTGDELKTYVRFRGARNAFPDPRLAAVFDAVREVEALVGNDQLEIELAVGADNSVYLFQVRPLIATAAPFTESATEAYLEKIAKKVDKLLGPHPYLYGDRSVFGVMPDWNPAEIVGLKPRMLALSLYKELITDSIWAYQRDNYGYKNLRSFPLLISLMGMPYIDVRVSFNSFIPAGVSEELSRKLVNHYITQLIESPQSHDKVEFDIVYSCYCPGLRDKLGTLREHGFEQGEIDMLAAELLTLTNSVLDPEDGLYRRDLEKIEELAKRRKQVMTIGMSTLDKIYWLLEDCKRYGTLPFSGLARAGFVAVQLLDALTELDLISGADRQAFLGSLNTVARRFSDDLRRWRAGTLDRESLLAEYGHLRPGTYDIRSARYDAEPELYLAAPTDAGPAPDPTEFRLDAEQRSRIDRRLADEGLAVDADGLFAFCRAAIEGREMAKWAFTRNLSDALTLVEQLGVHCGLDLEELSHVPIGVFLRSYALLEPPDLGDVLKREVAVQSEAYAVTQGLRLPTLLTSADEVYHFHLQPTAPNFVSLGKVRGEVVREEDLERVDLAGTGLKGKVICIRSADPGYDWLFSRGIGGLITQFGGANSHMAIRAAELQLPAVIGCGEHYFERWSAACEVAVDCAIQKVQVLR